MALCALRRWYIVSKYVGDTSLIFIYTVHLVGIVTPEDVNSDTPG
jgi:hypothetical protein